MTQNISDQTLRQVAKVGVEAGVETFIDTGIDLVTGNGLSGQSLATNFATNLVSNGTGSVTSKNGAVEKIVDSSHSLHNKGYKPQLGERTFDGYVKNNVSTDAEVKLYTASAEFNSNNGKIGGQFKRFGSDSHAGLSPHVHQPQRNATPKGDIYGGVGSKTSNGGVTSPGAKDTKQLYDYLNNGKYRR